MDLTCIYESEKCYKYNLTLHSSWAATQTKLSAIGFHPTTPWKLSSQSSHDITGRTRWHFCDLLISNFSIELMPLTAHCILRLCPLCLLWPLFLLTFPSSQATASFMDANLAVFLGACSSALISSHFSLLSLSHLVCSHIQVRPIFPSPDLASPWTSDSAFWLSNDPLHAAIPQMSLKLTCPKFTIPHACIPNMCSLLLDPLGWIPCHHPLGPLSQEY